jgi:hypothetical protein
MKNKKLLIGIISSMTIIGIIGCSNINDNGAKADSGTSIAKVISIDVYGTGRSGLAQPAIIANKGGKIVEVRLNEGTKINRSITSRTLSQVDVCVKYNWDYGNHAIRIDFCSTIK